MLKFIVIGVALFLIYKLFMGDKKKKEMEKEKTIKDKASSGEMIKDPICGTFVEKDGNIRVREGDTTHVFCSYECRDKYIKQLESITVDTKESD